MRLVSVVTSVRKPRGRDLAHLVQQVVDLHRHRADLDLRVEKAGGADHLFGEDAAGLLQLPRRGGGRDEDRLRPHRVPFLELQRPVVHAGRQAEAVLGQGELAPVVAAVHAADLRHRDVAFVGEDDGIVGDEFEQRRRRLAGGAAGEVARIVLDPVADAGGLQHLQIEVGALFQPLRLQQLALADELVEPHLQLGLDALDRLLHRRARGDVVAVGVDADLLESVGLGAGQRVEFGDRFQLLAEEAKTARRGLRGGRARLPGCRRGPGTLPRAKAASLRRYCWATSSAMILRWS